MSRTAPVYLGMSPWFYPERDEKRGRAHCVNQDALSLSAPAGAEHMWVCSRCGWENGPEFMSCRCCETLRAGVAP